MSQEQPAQPQPEAKPEPQPQTPPPPPPINEWFAPPGSTQHRDPFEMLSEVQIKPMQPMRPVTDLGDAIARSLEPNMDMMPHLEAPMLEMGDHQQTMTPMFRRGPSQGYAGMTCPQGSIGNCIYCSSLPCAALKAKVLEIVAMEYKLLANQQPRT